MSDDINVESLKELWEAGVISLPLVAQQYVAAANDVHDTRYYDAAFTTSEHGSSPLFEDFDDLRNMFQDKVLVQSRNNCESAGRVLAKIADAFATTDHLNAEDIDGYNEFKDPENRKEYEQPQSVSDAPTSDDPLPNPQD